MHDSGFGVTPAGPSYRVGQDRGGLWLAIERSGRGGGMFATQAAALRFARVETAGRTGAVVLAAGPVGFV